MKSLAGKIRLVASIFTATFTCLPAFSAPVQWTTGAGGNGHYYEFVAATVDWTTAKTAAEARTHLGLSGHLATITSAAEQSFIATSLGADISPMHAWAGGYQDKTAPDYSEPSGGWRWVTGETFSYTNWASGEPGSSLEEYLMFYNGSLSYTWNDAVNSGYYYSTYYSSGYLVEYEGTTTPVPTVTLSASPNTVSNGEAILLSWSTTDATSCNASGNWSGSRGTSGSESSGSLTSGNNTFTLSCSGAGGTTSATATVTVNGGNVSPLRPLQWATGAGGNGHYYEFVAATVDWTTAKTAAEARTHLGLSGHLATITSAAEQSFIAANLGADISPMHAWAGGYQDKTAPDYSEPSGGWRWITGEAFSYTNWAGGEPGSALEEYLMFYNGSLSYAWNDAVNSGYYYSTYYSSGYLVEYEGGPPTVTKNFTGTPGNNGWYTGDVSVNWVVDTRGYAEQSRQGCSSATINNDTAGTVLSCSVTTLAGTANDSITIKRDATAPVATATPSTVSNTNGWHKGSVSVAFTGTDATSGIASCSDAVSVSTEGDNQTSSQGTCTDNAGNVSTPVSYSPIRIDLTAPLVSAAVTPAANAAGWNNTAVVAVFSGTDALSGIALDGCAAPITLNANGSGQSASGGCTDRAGNSASATVSGINIDLTPPIATTVVSPAANAANWHRSPVTVSFAGTDSLSGSGVANCSANVVVGTDGAGQTRSGTCTDLAENISSLASATVNLDQAPPTISITAPVAGASYLQNSANSANYNCSDATSGMAACLGTTQSGTAFSTSNLGANTFTVQALDIAGNPASRTVSYTVTAPSPFTISATSLAFGSRLLNTSTALAVTIRNTSTAALALTAPTLSGTNANQFTLARTCGTSLAANASCTVTATFRPTTAGAKTAAFSIRIGTSTQTVSLGGTGVAVAFTVSPTSIPFPNQTRNTTSPAQVVTVANQTALPITLSTIALSGTNANQFILTRNCGTTLAANSSCTVNVAFRPTSAGAKRATLTVTPSGATAKTVALTGTGL